MILHNFNDSRFPQSDKDQIIAGVNIPKGYVNATEMIKFDPTKRINNYLRQKSTDAFLEALSADARISVSGLIIVLKGGNDKLNQGAWVHPEIAIDLAQWISPEFRLWANRVLRLVIENKVKTIEFDDAQRKLQWEYLRTQSKLARRKFTDCLKEYIITEHGENFYNSSASAKVFSKYTAIAQRELTGFPSFNGSRDNCSEEQLELLERFELSFNMMFETMYPEMSFDDCFIKVITKLKKSKG
jgi:hypothetical protein